MYKRLTYIRAEKTWVPEFSVVSSAMQDSKPQHFSRTQKRPTFVKETYFCVKETYIYVQETYIHPCRENMGTGIQRRLLGTEDSNPQCFSQTRQRVSCELNIPRRYKYMQIPLFYKRTFLLHRPRSPLQTPSACLNCPSEFRAN